MSLERLKTISVKLGNLAQKLKKDHRVEIGWFDDSVYPNGEKVADIAALQEYGGKGAEGNPIPPRPFVRPAYAENKGKWKELARKMIVRDITDERQDNIVKSLEAVGEVVKGDLQASIMKVFSPPLAKATIRARMRRRGVKDLGKLDAAAQASLTKPLVDTGVMIGSIRVKAE